VTGYYLIATGDPLFELHRVIRTLKDYNLRNPVSLWYYTRVLFGLEPYGLVWYGFTPLVAIAGTALAWRSHPRAVRLLLCWLVPILLIFEFGNRSPLPLHKNANYLSVIAIPLVLLAAFAIHAALLSPSMGRRRLGAIMLIALALTGPYGAWRLRAAIQNDAALYLTINGVIRQYPDLPVYLPQTRWPLFLSYFVRFDPHEVARWRDEDAITNSEEIEDALVVVHDRYLQADIEGKPRSRGEVHAFLWNPPATWRIVASQPGIPQYNSVRIYRVP
jgi:hypothetical protein